MGRQRKPDVIHGCLSFRDAGSSRSKNAPTPCNWPEHQGPPGTGRSYIAALDHPIMVRTAAGRERALVCHRCQAEIIGAWDAALQAEAVAA